MKAWASLSQLARVLQEQFSATQIVAFGSLTEKDSFTRWSDIDLAVWGIPPEQFYQAVAMLND